MMKYNSIYEEDVDFILSLYPALTGRKGWRGAGSKTARKSPIGESFPSEKGTTMEVSLYSSPSRMRPSPPRILPSPEFFAPGPAMRCAKRLNVKD